MVEFLRVKGWSDFQQYKDDRPIHWIKFHLSVLDDYGLDALPEISQLHLFKIWALAGKLKNKIPNDSQWLARQIGARSDVDLGLLIKKGFLVPYETVRDGTKPYGDKETPVPREEERREESNGSSAKPTNRNDYPPEFEELWKLRPERNGSDPKKPAYGAYKQRLKEGTSHADLEAGLKRYAAWCESTGKVGTETVMQTKRFFGPGREWENPWDIPDQQVKLPKDNRELWALRKKIGLPFEYENLEDCHNEIRQHLRKHPELRGALA